MGKALLEKPQEIDEITKRLECLRRLQKGSIRETPSGETILRTVRFIRTKIVELGATYEELGTSAIELRNLEHLAGKAI